LGMSAILPSFVARQKKAQGPGPRRPRAEGQKNLPFAAQGAAKIKLNFDQNPLAIPQDFWYTLAKEKKNLI
ncbi:MAG: hypothetical protein HDT20_09120, partial [Oscillibacter sp.]|nr:hypothetical protein [Oscillibacter sp.]